MNIKDRKDDTPENANPAYKKIVSFKVELISGSSSLAGFIENLSGDGIYMKTSPAKAAVDFTPGKIFEVKFQPLFGETLCNTRVCKYHNTCIVKFQPLFEEALRLQCKIKWSYKTPPHGLTNSIGMEVIHPHPTYGEFLKKLEWAV